ncbi:hypothetical protein FRB96_000554 [Tulasnella sp. 330]|nr:hypothetical protein FRB96_000554 [Tulasnella sp. 330]KAG8883143.1 hypothetical protein FRB98_003288 [Tulasnella sp. 332]
MLNGLAINTLFARISILTAVLRVAHVRGQATTDAICSPQTAWMKNAAGQTPCLVTAYLSGACNGSVWNLAPVLLPGPYRHPTGTSTAGPTKCRCNTVVYSLQQACSLCQGGAVGSWSDWTASCNPDIIDASGFPTNTPDGTIIPAWAGLDPTKTGSWNATQASQYAAANPTKSLTPTKKKSNVGAIVGGVVGGIVFLILLALCIFFYLRHRRQTREPKGDLISPTPYITDNLDQGYNHCEGDTSLPTTAGRTNPGLNPAGLMTTSPSPFGAMSNGNGRPASFRPPEPSDPSTFSPPTSPQPASSLAPTTGSKFNRSTSPAPPAYTASSTPLSSRNGHSLPATKTG